MIHLYSNGIAFIAKNIRVCNYKFDAASLPYSNFSLIFMPLNQEKGLSLSITECSAKIVDNMLSLLNKYANVIINFMHSHRKCAI